MIQYGPICELKDGKCVTLMLDGFTEAADTEELIFM
jgi:hypothetical protein